MGACVLALLLSGAARAAETRAPLTPLEQLGARLFVDASLSEPRGVSCASCHDPAKAFSGVNGSTIPGVARGAPAGSFGLRKPPSLAYASFSPLFSFVDKKDEETGKIEKEPVGGQFRDGRALDLAAQASGPLLNPVEMNNPSKPAVVAKVREGAYADLARVVFGKDVFDDSDAAFGKLMQAIAAYEGTEIFHPFASTFDAVLLGKRGFRRWRPRASRCSRIQRRAIASPVMSASRARAIPRTGCSPISLTTRSARRATRRSPPTPRPTTSHLGLCRREGLADFAPKGFDVESVCGAFKVPTLRNVELTAPYLHNGVLATLRDAVAFYATRDTNPERWYPRGADGSVAKFNDLPDNYHNVNVKEVPYDRRLGQRPRLSESDIDALAAFLRTLTDKRGE